MTILETPRLRLEPLAEAHLAGFHAMSSDPEVMRHLGGVAENVDASKAALARVQAAWARFGFSWWAFVDRGTGDLVGAGCVQHLRRSMETGPDPACPLELGWRLRREHWGQGFASEGARAMAAFAFDRLGAPELLAVCEPANAASAAVMQRLGMTERGIEDWYGGGMMTYGIDVDEWRRREAARVGSPSSRGDAGSAAARR